MRRTIEAADDGRNDERRGEATANLHSHRRDHDILHPSYLAISDAERLLRWYYGPPPWTALP